MIPLRLPVVTPFPLEDPLVFRLRHDPQEDDLSVHHLDAVLVGTSEGQAHYDMAGLGASIRVDDPSEIAGDVLFLPRGSTTAHRLIRARSDHNTFLVTERCDQLCVMCSQPPKDYEVDFFDSFTEACRVAPRGKVIGLSGGEPLLLKDRLWDFLLGMAKERPDLTFHVLTNGQHFTPDDLPVLRALGAERVLWGIPLYSAVAAEHDRIVGKVGAFETLTRNLALLVRAGAAIELRTVVMRSNAAGLPALSRFVSTHLPGIHVWAIMQMERIGYGRMNWAAEFFDSSVQFAPIKAAIDAAVARGLPVSLYNFPLCTVPDDVKPRAAPSISDWKRKFLPACSACSQRDACCGFFEWSSQGGGFERISTL